MNDNINKKNFIFTKLFIIVINLFFLSLFLYYPVFKKLFFKQDKFINVYAPTDMIATETIKKFNKKTGIKVNLKYFDTNEELYAKFKAGGGKGYDIMLPSDYLVDLLIKDNLLTKIDKTRLENFKNIDKKLTGHYFDKENDYSIPYVWSVNGIIFDKEKLNNIKVDWDFVFKKAGNLGFEICMLDSLREVVFLSSIYLFGQTTNFPSQNLDKIKELLIKQKKWVEVYLYSSLQYYLLSDVVSVAVTTSAFAKKILDASKRFEFLIPEKGSIITIDNLVVSKETEKMDLAYKFIDFIISEKNLAHNSNLFGYNPANKKSYELLDSVFLNNKNLLPNKKRLNNLHLIHNKLNLKKLEDLWLEVKLS